MRLGSTILARGAEAITGILMCLLATGASAQDSDFTRRGVRTISPPRCYEVQSVLLETRTCSREEHAAWLADLRNWRQQRREYVGHSPARYQDPRTLWTQRSFVQTQVGVEDRYLYDVATGRYTVDRYLDDLIARYGGLDSVLVWPFYPNSGIDARNHIDMIRSMPGGVAGVRDMIAQFHRRGVKVLLPTMMWDQGTRDPGKPWPEAVAEIVREVGADGVNGDTFDGVPLAFNEAAERQGLSLAFESELGFDDRLVANNLMAWGYYSYPSLPLLDRAKWLEPRHMIHVNDRWAHDRTDMVHTAFFMGTGYESWENVWGVWNGITPRDGELIRRYAMISRQVAPFLTSEDWEPFLPTERPGVYASYWPKDGQRVWTLVNRNGFAVGGPQLSVEARPGARYFDLYHGTEITPRTQGGRDWLMFDIEAKGIGAVIALTGAPDAAMQRFLNGMKAAAKRPLADFDARWQPLRQEMVPVPPSRRYPTPPQGMIEIPAASDFLFRVRGVQREEDKGYVDVQYPWESDPRRDHLHSLPIARFFLDRTPVTNGEFAGFLKASGYAPTDRQNFLNDWDGGAPRTGWERKPVTWVGIEDARAYCRWAGKRLPREWEWQYVAEGGQGRRYPWGQDWRADAVPVPDTSRAPRAPDDVGAHPQGASAFGVEDMVGLVWQWTDEVRDPHTRSGILRGGSYYQPAGSRWYFPQAYRNDEHNKLLLMAPAKERSAMIGFRCAADAG